MTLPGGARRILILAPHPDDEIAACGIAAMRASAAGATISVLYLTTGVPESPALWPWQRGGRAAWVRRRREEALNAARLVGLQAVGFRDTPTRCLRFDLDAARREIEAAIATSAPDALWVPAFEGAHQDHEAANALAATFADRLPVWEFASYNFVDGKVRANRFHSEIGGETAIEATEDEAALKQRALDCYASERRNLRHIGVAYEVMRPLPAHDYAAPPHPGRLFRERFHWVPFRHPRVDFDPSTEVYRDIVAWVSTRRRTRAAALGKRPGGEPR